MAKNKVSEWSPLASNNTDVGGVDISEGCAPSGINNAIRMMMAEIKDFQAGTAGDDFTCSGTLGITGGFTLDGAAGTAGQLLASGGAGNTPTWVGNPIPSGVILLWSGSIATIPAGWYLCNGSNGTPDLRNRFIVGASQDNAGVANTTITGANTLTGGSKDSIVVEHTHTGTTNTTGEHSHTFQRPASADGDSEQNGSYGTTLGTYSTSVAGDHSHTFTTASTGSTGTNANLPPYYALCYIMKA